MAVEGAKQLDECRRRLKEKLDGCFARNDDPQKLFARRGVTREIFEQDRLCRLLLLLCHDSTDEFHRVVSANPESIAKRIRGSEDSPHCCNNVLAILLYSECKDRSLRSLIEGLIDEKSSKSTFDRDLPLTQSKACEAFGDDDGHKFWMHQYLFCPVILKERHEAIYVDHKQSCPRPFLEEPEKIGRGAYAIVYRVRIEKGHLINDQGANDRNEYAMKEYIGYDAEARKSFVAEGTTIKQFIQCAKSHDNIATTKASLEWGNTYSLFFDLANCNLWEYFMNDAKDDADTLNTLVEKQRIFGRTIGLAGALTYLHDELYLDSTNEQLQCYHLDLKPQNILVFGTSGNEIWKISDFGISQIKRVPPNKSHGESEHHISFLDKIFKSKTPDDDPSSGVHNSRYGGTYAAPEAKEKSDTVTRKSDVWSLACIITLVLTFLHDRSRGIVQFQKSRARDRSHDWFFDSKALKAGSEAKEILHGSVSIWLDTLNDEASRRDKSEAKATKMATELLKRSMFLQDQESRLRAKDVERELRVIQSSFSEVPENPPIHNPPKSPQRDRISHLRRLRRLRHLVIPRHHKENHKIVTPQRPSLFDIPDDCMKCKFSADGRYLCAASDGVMAIKPISGIQQGQKGSPFPSPKDKKWADFSLGSKYLCAALDSEDFEFSYLPLSTEGDSDRCDLNTRVKCRIRKVVISPNDQITAFVLEGSHQGRKTLRVALYRTYDLLGLSSPSKASVKTHGSSSTSRSSTTASTLDELPWKDIMRDTRESELPIGAQLTDLKFSSDSNILMGITEPFKQQGSQGMQYDVITWDVTNGRRFSPLTNHTTGYDGMGESWAVDTFAVFATEPSFVTISKKRIRWSIYDPPGSKSQSKVMSDELLDVLVTDEEDELILVGRSDSRGPINAFRVSTSQIKGLESLGRGLSSGFGQHYGTTDCCCLAEKEDKLVIMVAIIDPREHKGKLYETVLE